MKPITEDAHNMPDCEGAQQSPGGSVNAGQLDRSMTTKTTWRSRWGLNAQAHAPARSEGDFMHYAQEQRSFWLVGSIHKLIQTACACEARSTALDWSSKDMQLHESSDFGQQANMRASASIHVQKHIHLDDDAMHVLSGDPIQTSQILSHCGGPMSFALKAKSAAHMQRY